MHELFRSFYLSDAYQKKVEKNYLKETSLKQVSLEGSIAQSGRKVVKIAKIHSVTTGYG